MSKTLLISLAVGVLMLAGPARADVVFEANFEDGTRGDFTYYAGNLPESSTDTAAVGARSMKLYGAIGETCYPGGYISSDDETLIAANNQYTTSSYLYFPSGLQGPSGENKTNRNIDFQFNNGNESFGGPAAVGGRWLIKAGDALYDGNGKVNMTLSGLGGVSVDDYAMPVAADAWHHLVVDHNLTTGKARVYVDEILQGTYDIENTSVPVRVGTIGISSAYHNIDGWHFYVDDYTMTTVPEPATLALLSVGLFGLVGRRKQH